AARRLAAPVGPARAGRPVPADPAVAPGAAADPLAAAAGAGGLRSGGPSRGTGRGTGRAGPVAPPRRAVAGPGRGGGRRVTVRRVRVAALAGLAAGVLPLAGCTSVPDSSSPRVVQQLNPSGPATEQGVLQDTRPGVGATEVQIVDGFIGAQPAWQDGHEPARRFLTHRAAAQWRDDASMTVAATRPTVTASDYYRHVVSVTFTPVGTVAQDGSYLPVLRAGRSVTWPLKLRKQAGEWRIDSLPAGTLLSRAQVDQSYQAPPLYFLDPAGRPLVARPRYLPHHHDTPVPH